MADGQILLAILVGIVMLQTCRAQIKFEPLRAMACYTCEDEASNADCNTTPVVCPNSDDACMAVVWTYRSGRQRVYKQCVPSSFCKDFRGDDCFNTGHLLRCRYCCWGPECNEPAVSRRPGKWARTDYN